MAIKITREFQPADRYTYDFKLCTAKAFFAQVDTRQDASYYGTWANPTKRVVVNYCEGDVTIHECETDEEFVSVIRDIAKWNQEQGYVLRGSDRAIGIDPGFNPDLKAAFEAVGLGDLLH